MKHQIHRKRIKRIAEELGAPSHIVRKAYFGALRELSGDARIQDFLHVFIAKRVRRALHNRHPGET